MSHDAQFLDALLARLKVGCLMDNTITRCLLGWWDELTDPRQMRDKVRRFLMFRCTPLVRRVPGLSHALVVAELNALRDEYGQAMFRRVVLGLPDHRPDSRPAVAKRKLVLTGMWLEDFVWYPLCTVGKPLAPRRIWRLAVSRPRCWAMERPQLVRRLPHWLARSLVSSHLMVTARIEDEIGMRDGSPAPAPARVRVAARVDTRERVLHELDSWARIMREVRAGQAGEVQA
jgi:hypothetical protein